MEFGRIDVHTHLLPGVDDGCATEDDSLRCAETLAGAGYTHAFCTPHVWPSLPHNTAGFIRERTLRLQERLDSAGVALKLIPGGELNLLASWPGLAEMPAEEIVTYGLSGRYALFDFWSDRFPEVLLRAIGHLQSLGMTVILAHPERIGVFQADARWLDRLTEAGVLLQMNTWCLTESAETDTRRIAERLLREDRYFLLGTDLHKPDGMRSRIEGIDRAVQLVGTERVDQLTRVNPRRLLGSE